MYAVAIDGSHCTCPGFRFRNHCKHADAQAEAYEQDGCYHRWAA
jgi:uncharacterized Zn finger protein